MPWLESGFYQQSLFLQDFVCLVNSAHPRIGETLTLRAYNEEAHVAITAGTGAQLLEDAMSRQSVKRRVVLELPRFPGLSGIVSATDLIATLPRRIGETLADLAGLKVMECPLALPSFTIKQHWHRPLPPGARQPLAAQRDRRPVPARGAPTGRIARENRALRPGHRPRGRCGPTPR